MIVGKRRGSSFAGTNKSITNTEFECASSLGIPILAFVDKEVMSHISTYRKNPKIDLLHIVDDKRVFHFIEYISSGHEDNWLHQYSTINDIKDVLLTQFAYYLLLFSRHVRNKTNFGRSKSEEDKISATKFPLNLNGLSRYESDQDALACLKKGLKKVYKIITGIISSKTKEAGKKEKILCLWIISSLGTEDGSVISLNNDIFKDRAWSATKGTRIFNQLKEFGVVGYYEEEWQEGGFHIFLKFENDRDGCLAYAISFYCKLLLNAYGDEGGFEKFKHVDMRFLSK